MDDPVTLWRYVNDHVAMCACVGAGPRQCQGHVRDAGYVLGDRSGHDDLPLSQLRLLHPWGKHIAAAGFRINDQVRDDIDRVKQANGIAMDQYSCHTDIVEGYVIEGHVPASSIQRLLAERPEKCGLALPGMPIGSPGMELQGRRAAHLR